MILGGSGLWCCFYVVRRLLGISLKIRALQLWTANVDARSLGNTTEVRRALGFRKPVEASSQNLKYFRFCNCQRTLTTLKSEGYVNLTLGPKVASVVIFGLFFLVSPSLDTLRTLSWGSKNLWLPKTLLVPELSPGISLTPHCLASS